MSAFVLLLVSGTLTACNERIGSRCRGSARSTSGIYAIKCISGRWRITGRLAPPPPPVTTPPPSISLSGTGSNVLPVSLRPGVKYVLTANYQAVDQYDTFVVRSYTTGLVENRSLIYALFDGNYSGTVPVNIYDTDVGAIGVSAPGSWQLELKPLTGNVPAGSGPFSGTGPAVVEYKGPSIVTGFSHSGSGYIGIKAYTLGDVSLIVNEVGAYWGVHVLPGNSLVVIDADGPWTVG